MAGALLLVGELNLVLARQLPDDVRQLVKGKKLRIHVRDARLTFDFSWTGRRFAACPKQQATDLTLSATAHDFLRLAQRLEVHLVLGDPPAQVDVRQPPAVLAHVLPGDHA